MTIDNFVIDHVIPQSQLKTRKEKQDINNLVIACKSCNLRKATMPAELFFQWIEYEKAKEKEEGSMDQGDGESTLQPGRELEVETDKESSMETGGCVHCESSLGPVPEEVKRMGISFDACDDGACEEYGCAGRLTPQGRAGQRGCLTCFI